MVAGVRYLCEGLKEQQGLKRLALNFYQNGIEDEGIKCIHLALLCMPLIEELELVLPKN